jgi:transposase
MVALSKTIRAHRQQLLAAVDLRLSNRKLEGLNSKIRPMGNVVQVSMPE